MKLALLAEAEAELHEAAAWYDEQREGLGDELLLEVHDALAIILATPETWARCRERHPAFHPFADFFCTAFRTRSRIRRVLV